jgi:hypothetical protein
MADAAHFMTSSAWTAMTPPLARQVNGVVGHRLWRSMAARICASGVRVL